MRVVPVAVDPADLEPRHSRADVRRALGVPDDAPVLVSVGSLSAEKRPDRMLHAIRGLHDEFPSLYAWFVGDGPLRNSMQTLAQSLGIMPAVRFLGAQERVGEYLNAADLFILTSDTEGMPAVLLEAGYAGLTAVATNVGGVRECVVDGETGILVAPEEEAVLVQALAAAVARLLRNPARRAEMGDRAHDFVSDDFTIDRVSARYVEFYRTLRDEFLLQSPQKP